VRQGQQNRRGRGRNNNRKGGHHNPLSRSFESNGPAERIRGTPAHIAEKYLSLARDAQASGDTVLEQNYLQHAEHYNRIIMAYRDQFNQPHEGGMNGGGHRMRNPGDTGESFDEGGDDDMGGDEGFPQPFLQAPAHPGHQPQPQPRPHEARQPGGEHVRPDRADHRAERPERPDRPDRPDRPFRRDRDQGRPPRFGDRGDRQGFGDRDRQAERQAERQADPRAEPRGDGPERAAERAPDVVAEPAGEPRRRAADRFQQPHEQPEFLRRPVRRVRSSESGNGESGKTEPTGE
jgi:hypothetical protein